MLRSCIGREDPVVRGDSPLLACGHPDPAARREADVVRGEGRLHVLAQPRPRRVSNVDDGELRRRGAEPDPERAPSGEIVRCRGQSRSFTRPTTSPPADVDDRDVAAARLRESVTNA